MTNTRIGFVLLFAISICYSGAVKAQNVTITDNNAPHSPIIRFNQFSTDLTARPNDPPVSTSETTVAGPTYAWSCTSPSPGFSFALPTPTGNTATLNSATPSATNVLTAGTNTVTVSCTAAYLSTDNNTGVVTPINLTGSLPVTFFVRVPKYVANDGVPNDTTYWANKSQDTVYGCMDIYPLQMQDNQSMGYGNGLVHEEFTNVSPSRSQLNAGGPGTAVINYSNGTGSPLYNFSDHNGFTFATAYNYNAVCFSFNQTWYDMELTPPYNAPNGDLYVTPGEYTAGQNTPTLSGFLSNVAATGTQQMTLKEEYGQVFRSWSGQSPY